MEILLNYEWPGNVRELENALERACALSEGELIKVEDLPPYLREKADTHPGLFLPQDELSIKKVTRQIEMELIRRALEKTRGNRTQAAKLLEISHRALIYKLKEYGLDKLLPSRVKLNQEGKET